MATGELRYFWIIFLFRILFTLADDECGPPPDISHGSAVTEENEFPVGTEVKYKCNFGYYFASIKRSATCELDRSEELIWNIEDIECKPVSCGEPQLIKNGQILGSRYTYPNSVEYVCDVGYNLKGINMRFCGTDGGWSGRTPSCTIVTCPKPEEIANGTVSYSSTLYGSVATYNCKGELQIEGDNTLKCNAEGKWSGVLPKCKELFCPEPSKPTNGAVALMNGNRNIGSLVVYNCNSGFNLIGSSYAKCLATGKWSFESPKCVSLCTVPSLGRGKMGKIEYLNFKQINPDTKIEHGKKLLLRCNHNYEIPTEEWLRGDVEITCNFGTFEPTPACHPARCRTPPPTNKKGRPVENYKNNHNSIVLYVGACSETDIILQNKTAKCYFGKWQVQEARCKDTRCHPNTLKHISGLITKNSRYYESEEFFDVHCKTGFDKVINKIVCKSGTWETKSLPCKPASCSDEPPTVENGGVYEYSSRHGSEAKYYCFPPYVIEDNYNVICQYGIWTGKGPTCKSNQCNVNELEKYEGVQVENKLVRNGNWHQIACEKGYDNEIHYIWCKNQKWEEISTEPCKPGKCIVPYLPNGEIKKVQIIERWWPYDDEIKRTSVRSGSSINHGTEYFIFCRNPYKFQGIEKTGENGKSISCNKKQWYPKPECLLDPITPAPTEFPDQEITTEKTTTKQQKEVSTENNFIGLNINNTEEKNETVTDLKSSNSLNKCIYKTLDSNLIAFLNENATVRESNFVHGTHLKFSCFIPGKFRLRGPVEAKCENGTWEPYLPSCHFPTKDDDVIINIQSHNSTLHPGNLIMVKENTQLVIACQTIKGDKWPKLSSNASKRTEGKSTQTRTGFSYTYIHIPNMTNDYSGNYSCIAPAGNHHSVVIRAFSVIQCPIPQNPKNGQVFYNSLEYNSEINYTCNYNYKLVGEAKVKCKENGQWSQIPICHGNCRHPGDVQYADIMNENFEAYGEIHYECKYGYRLIGNSTLRCLVTGEWSSQKPICKEIRCPVPHNPENGEVDYRSLTFNSEIIYKCRDGYKLIGEEKVKCQYNSQWSSVPTCKEIQMCNVYDLVERLPNDVVVTGNMTEYVVNGTNVPLLCAGDNLILLGQKYATCFNRLWRLGKTECVYGCYPIQIPENSSLILENYKESYRIGESIIFSCPEDEELEGDIELVFCLHIGWSDDRLPNCVPVKS